MSDLREKFKDKLWRLANLYWIVDEKGHKLKFRPRPAQLAFYHDIHFFNVILKARQLGFTTFIDLLALDMALFTSNFSVVIIAHRKEDAQKIFREKVKDVYNSLPAEIKLLIPATKNDAGELILANGSSVRVTTSSRSGTCQFLHVSEFGKICAKYPEKAKEIITGSLPSVHPGGFSFFESTAEGNEGYFFDMCNLAEKIKELGRKLLPQEFKFHFYAWWDNPDYQIREDVQISESLLKYFDDLALKHNIELSQAQMNWYAFTKTTLGDDMHREHPSYPQEAFRVSTDGAFYKREFLQIYREKRICKVNYETYLPVYTFWDLGVSDDTGIWFTQFAGKEIRLIDYYCCNGEGLPHYVKVLQEKGYRYGGHFAPHDIAVREFSTGKSRIDFALELGLKFEPVATSMDLIGGIEQVRTLLSQCYFDEDKCDDENKYNSGIKALENYRKEWDEKHGMFKSKPLHDWTSHGSDAFRTMAVAWGNRQIPFNIGTRQQYPQIATLGNWKV